MREEKVLVRARFDEKLPHYWLLAGMVPIACTCVFIPLLPIWFFIGRVLHQKQFERLECELTERSLNIRRGLWFRVEKNIPLDKIQDVSMKEGPILRHLGLSALSVETAGQSAPQGHGDATLAGVVDAPAFRDAILNQRDVVVGTLGVGASTSASPKPSAGDADGTRLLGEIRDSLQRIEGLLERRDERRS